MRKARKQAERRLSSLANRMPNRARKASARTRRRETTHGNPVTVADDASRDRPIRCTPCRAVKPTAQVVSRPDQRRFPHPATAALARHCDPGFCATVATAAPASIPIGPQGSGGLASLWPEAARFGPLRRRPVARGGGPALRLRVRHPAQPSCPLPRGPERSLLLVRPTRPAPGPDRDPRIVELPGRENLSAAEIAGQLTTCERLPTSATPVARVLRHAGIPKLWRRTPEQPSPRTPGEAADRRPPPPRRPSRPPPPALRCAPFSPASCGGPARACHARDPRRGLALFAGHDSEIEKHPVSKRSRRQKGIPAFLARDVDFLARDADAAVRPGQCRPRPGRAG